MKRTKVIVILAILIIISVIQVYGAGDVAGAVVGTWTTARTQIKSVVDNVIFPVLDLILAVFLFVKIGSAYFDYRKSGQFEWTAPAILFACLIFMLTAPMYIWGILGM